MMAHEMLVSVGLNGLVQCISIDLAGIAAKMRSKAGPAYRILEKVEDHEKFINQNEHTIVGMSSGRSFSERMQSISSL